MCRGERIEERLSLPFGKGSSLPKEEKAEIRVVGLAFAYQRVFQILCSKALARNSLPWRAKFFIPPESPLPMPYIHTQQSKEEPNHTTNSSAKSIPDASAPAMSRRQEARNQASPALGMRGYTSPSLLPVFSPPRPEYAGSASAAAHAWWERAAAGSPSLSAPTDW
jgi:hypothetical protein